MNTLEGCWSGGCQAQAKEKISRCGEREHGVGWDDKGRCRKQETDDGTILPPQNGESKLFIEP